MDIKGLGVLIVELKKERDAFKRALDAAKKEIEFLRERNSEFLETVKRNGELSKDCDDFKLENDGKIIDGLKEHNKKLKAELKKCHKEKVGEKCPKDDPEMPPPWKKKDA